MSVGVDVGGGCGSESGVLCESGCGCGWVSVVWYWLAYVLSA